MILLISWFKNRRINTLMVYLYRIFRTLLQATHVVYHKLQEIYYVDKTSCNRDALRVRSDDVRNEQVINFPTDCY